MSVHFIITAPVGETTTVSNALSDVADFYEREAARLHREAGLTTGRGRKDKLAQASYAARQVGFWREVTVEEATS